MPSWSGPWRVALPGSHAGDRIPRKRQCLPNEALGYVRRSQREDGATAVLVVTVTPQDPSGRRSLRRDARSFRPCGIWGCPGRSCTPRFALNPETGVLEQVVDAWHTGFVDLSGDQGFDRAGRRVVRLVMPGRGWPLKPRGGAGRLGRGNRHVFGLPGRRRATSTGRDADSRHFHVVQLANRTVAAVCRRVTATLRGRRVRKDDPSTGCVDGYCVTVRT